MEQQNPYQNYLGSSSLNNENHEKTLKSIDEQISQAFQANVSLRKSKVSPSKITSENRGSMLSFLQNVLQNRGINPSPAPQQQPSQAQAQPQDQAQESQPPQEGEPSETTDNIEMLEEEGEFELLESQSSQSQAQFQNIANQIAQLEGITNPFPMSMNPLSGLFGSNQFGSDNKPNASSAPSGESVKNYFDRALELLFESDTPERTMAQLYDEHLTLGVCAKTLKSGDVAWKCEDCEKDPTCIICAECFQKSDHEGHKVWLKTNVGGCCDCGDPEAWEAAGCCSDHKGIDSSKDAALNVLPAKVRQNAKEVFLSLAKVLKDILLNLIKHKNEPKMKEVYEGMVDDFITQMAKILEAFKQSIFYISEAYTEVFYGAHEIDSSETSHKCCYRYFVSEEHQEKFEEEKAIYESMNEKEVSVDPDSKWPCSCSVIDLLCMTDTLYDNIKSSKLNKKINHHFISLFQSYHFKEHLAFSYITNIQHISIQNGQQKGMTSLGVQILTIDSITSRIFADEHLAKEMTSVLSEKIQKFQLSKPRQKLVFYDIMYMMHDFKYIAKPQIMAQLVDHTLILDQLIEASALFSLTDAENKPLQLEAYGDMNFQDRYIDKQLEMELSSRVLKYLSYVHEPRTIKRLFGTFSRVICDLDQRYENEHAPKRDGFFMIPVLRLFSYFVTRVFMKFMISENVGMNPTQTVNLYQKMLDMYINDAQQAQDLISAVLKSVSIHMGFCDDIRARKWILKGEAYLQIPHFQLAYYKEYYLVGVQTFQMGVLLSSNPSKCFDQLLAGYSFSDEWMDRYVTMLRDDQEIGTQVFENIKNFDAQKLASQVNFFFNKIVEILITEASFILPIEKKLFPENHPNKEQLEGQIQEISANHMQREVMHLLFSLGANATIDQIKKEAQASYEKTALFGETLLKLSQLYTDSYGKKLFRLKQKEGYEAMFDPFYIVKSQQKSNQQTSYEQFHRQNPDCNNIVGDYKGAYKYSTSINKSCCVALALNQPLVMLIVKTLRECLSNLLMNANPAQETSSLDTTQNFKNDLFPRQTLNVTLKLLITVIQNMQNKNETLAQIRSYLPKELIVQAIESQHVQQDTKLATIFTFIKTEIFPEDLSSNENKVNDSQSDTQKPVSQIDTAAAAKAKKLAAQKKKAALIAKMKSKQKSQLKIPDNPAETPMKIDQIEMEQDQPMEDQQSTEFNMTCANCQEDVRLEDFYERPFAQLCYNSANKLLFYSYLKTYSAQKQSMLNLREAQNFSNTLPKLDNLKAESMEEEEKKGSEILDCENRSRKDSKISQNDPQSQIFGGLSEEEINLVLNDLKLKDVVDSKHYTGVSMTKCCHVLHFDCLSQYITAETQIGMNQQRIRQVIGQEQNSIQCPLCKTIKNTWQPFLPLGLENSDTSKEQLSDLKHLQPYIDFCSQLIVNQQNNASVMFDKSRNLPMSYLGVDIQKDPESFLSNMMQVVTNLVLEAVSLKHDKLLAKFDATAQQDDTSLRDVVFIILTTRELVKRIYFDQSAKMDQLADLMFIKLSTDLFKENLFEKNFAKLIIQMLFISAMRFDSTETFTLIRDAILKSLYQAFKCQLVMNQIFRRKNGAIKKQDLESEIEHAFGQNQSEQQHFQEEDVILSQMHFLRAATAINLAIDAVMKTQSTQNHNLVSSNLMQLYLNQNLIDQLSTQIEDKAEFILMTNYLGLDPSLNPKILSQNLSEQLVALKESTGLIEQVFFTLEAISGLGSDIKNQALSFCKVQSDVDDIDDSNDKIIEMHPILNLLTPYFTFDFVEVPLDFQTLVKEYYTRQCRGCKKQLQKSALCLLCGEIVCYVNSQKCCGDRPGMMKVESSSPFSMFRDDMEQKSEGELSYHARVSEGGCSVFLIPQTAEVFYVDCGRMIKGESFYRNNLGEVFSEKNTRRWDNFFLDEESGGVKIKETLRKLFMGHKMPEKIMQGRLTKNSVIMRHLL